MGTMKRLNSLGRNFLMPLVAGALIAVSSGVAYVNSERAMPLIAKILVSTISLAFIPWVHRECIFIP
jgi:hypothetical protein